MNALDAIVTLALDANICHLSKTIPEKCETHGADMYGVECEIIADRRSLLRSTIGDLTPIMIDWLAGMIEGAATELEGEVSGDVRIGYRGAAALLRRWDPWVEFEDDV